MEVGMKTKDIEITYQCPPQRATITEETWNEQDKMTQSVDISQGPSLTTPIFAQWAHGWSRYSDREEAIQGTKILSPMLIQLLVLSIIYPASNREQYYFANTAPSLKDTQDHFMISWLHLDPFHTRRHSDSFLQKWTHARYVIAFSAARTSVNTTIWGFKKCLMY